QLATRAAFAGLEGRDFAAAFESVAGQVAEIVGRVRVLHPLGLAQVLDLLGYLIIARIYRDDADAGTSEDLDAALRDNLLPALESHAAPRLGALAALFDGSLKRWFAAFLEHGSGGYQIDPQWAQVAAELLSVDGEVAGKVDGRERDIAAWKQWIGEAEPTLTGEFAAMPALANFAAALRRLAAQREL
ncbi:MAG: hypothetical protein KC431_17095, partial [Myxococcales bacterium]|nr:hypothetical protein [Myxococcales bacterium]